METHFSLSLIRLVPENRTSRPVQYVCAAGEKLTFVRENCFISCDNGSHFYLLNSLLGSIIALLYCLFFVVMFLNFCIGPCVPERKSCQTLFVAHIFIEGKNTTEGPIQNCLRGQKLSGSQVATLQPTATRQLWEAMWGKGAGWRVGLLAPVLASKSSHRSCPRSTPP